MKSEANEFLFEDDKYKLVLEIGSYADDPENIGFLACYDDAELLHNSLTCGRSYYDKIKETSGFSMARELILIKDVATMRNGVKAFREGKIDQFGEYPEIGVFGDEWAYFKIKLSREGGVGHCDATIYQPYGTTESAHPLATDEFLLQLERFFSNLLDRYPIRPFDGNMNKVEGSGSELIIDSEADVQGKIDKIEGLGEKLERLRGNV